jgi:hypothetical protein
MSKTVEIFTLKVMAKGFGDKDRKYDPTDPDAVKKIKAYITKRIKEGWILYGGIAGQKTLEKIANVDDIDKVDLDRFMLTQGQKLLAAPIIGG